MTDISRRTFCGLAVAATSTMLVGNAFAATETTLEKIRRTGQMTVATEAAYAPYEFVKDGKIVGLGADLLAIVSEELGAKVEQLDLPSRASCPACWPASSTSSPPRSASTRSAPRATPTRCR